jgi:chromosome segregation ATPase
MEEKLSGIQGQLDGHATSRHQRHQIIAKATAEAQSLQSQAGRQTNKLAQRSRDAAKAWEWIQKNREIFQGHVFGPPMIECTVKDPKYINAVEQVIGQSELQAFTVTNQADFKMLLNQLQTVMGLPDVNVRASLGTLRDFRAPHTEDELRQLGFDCWMSDVIEGPDAVLAMLCDNRNLHSTAFGNQPVPESKERELERSSISAYATPTKLYNITRRREYGPGAVVTRVTTIKKAQTLTDAPVDTQAQRRVKDVIREAEYEISQIEEEEQGLKAEAASKRKDLKDLITEIAALTQDKTTRQAQDTWFKGLPTKLEGVRKKLEDAHATIAEVTGKILEIREKQDKLCQDKGQQCLDYANAVLVLRDLHAKCFEAEIMRIEAKSDYDQLKAQQTDEERLLVERVKERDELIIQTAELKQRAKAGVEQCTRLGETFTDEETEVQKEVAEWEPQRLETEIQALQGSLDSLHGGNENIIREFEQRARKIEAARAKLDDIEAALSELMSNITEIRDLWEPQLDELISQISDAFAENFAKIQCAGEVGVFKDDDFDNWAIQIKVKFRYVSLLRPGRHTLTTASQRERDAQHLGFAPSVRW